MVEVRPVSALFVLVDPASAMTEPAPVSVTEALLVAISPLANSSSASPARLIVPVRVPAVPVPAAEPISTVASVPDPLMSIRPLLLKLAAESRSAEDNPLLPTSM